MAFNRMPYMLEVQTTLIDVKSNGTKEHLGYINRLFETKQEAREYYNLHNLHMSKIVECSDVDPKTKFVYVIRKYTGEWLRIPGFEECVYYNIFNRDDIG